MAIQKKENTTNTATTTRKKKEAVVEEKQPNYDEIIAQLMNKIENLETQLSEKPQKQEQIYSGKKIKCINLMHNMVNVSTDEDGLGKVYSFKDYGDSQMIKFDDLANIVNNYPNTMENGLIYISDKQAVDELGLVEDYAKLYDKKILDKIIRLHDESDVDMLLGIANKELLESTIRAIAERINQKEAYDYNYLNRIKTESGYDVIKLAEDLSALTIKK